MDAKLLDSKVNKYELINDALRWARVLQVREQSGVTMQELINRALMEILDGKVTQDQIREAALSKEVVQAEAAKQEAAAAATAVATPVDEVEASGEKKKKKTAKAKKSK